MYNITEEQAEELARLQRLEKNKELLKRLEEEANGHDLTCHAVDVGDEPLRPEYCEGKQRLHPSLSPCCCSQCCTCGG